MAREAVIVEAVRTPIGRRGGTLKDTRPDDLAAIVLQEVVDRTGISKASVEDVVLGCVTQIDEQGLNIARLAALVAGFPETVPGTSVNRQCASGLQAVNFAAQGIIAGVHDLLLAGGVESMSRVPMGSDAGVLNERLLAKYEIVPQGISADYVADKYKITREQMDEYSMWSQRRAVKAIDEGRFRREIVPVPVKDEQGSKKLFEVDEHPRRNTSLEKLASLPPAFRPDGKITAGNSSGINDGASAVLLTSGEKAQELGLTPRARIVTMAVVGTNPTIMLEGPIPVSRLALRKAGLSVDDIDIWEINEAFASVPLATIQTLGLDHAKVNVNGGAISLGHPLGASGARILTTMLHEMERADLRYGLATLCIGFGQGVATIIERVR
jgi:acetyl-CoA acetyltransferase family protein